MTTRGMRILKTNLALISSPCSATRERGYLLAIDLNLKPEPYNETHLNLARNLLDHLRLHGDPADD